MKVRLNRLHSRHPCARRGNTKALVGLQCGVCMRRSFLILSIEAVGSYFGMQCFSDPPHFAVGNLQLAYTAILVFCLSASGSKRPTDRLVRCNNWFVLFWSPIVLLAKHCVAEPARCFFLQKISRSYDTPNNDTAGFKLVSTYFKLRLLPLRHCIVQSSKNAHCPTGKLAFHLLLFSNKNQNRHFDPFFKKPHPKVCEIRFELTFLFSCSVWSQ